MDKLNIGNQSENILQQLRDIHLPVAASNWPPAPGWIALLIILLVIGIGISIIILRNYPIWQTKKHALQLLKNYQSQYPQAINSQKACSLVNELLKKTAFFYYPRPMVASLKGQAWLNFLNQTMFYQSQFDKFLGKFAQKNNQNTKLDFTVVAKELLEYPYQNHQDINLDKLFSLANIWVKNQRHFSKKLREKSCLN